MGKIIRKYLRLGLTDEINLIEYTIPKDREVGLSVVKFSIKLV